MYPGYKQRGTAMSGIGVKAQILVEPRVLRPRTLPRRTVQEGGWLAVEATSLSGIDAQAWAGEISQLAYPVILGRQIVGRIADSVNGDLPYEIGSRVLVEPVIRCRRCSSCAANLSYCSRRRPVNSYGMIPSLKHPGLWGGMAETLYLDPCAQLHQISDDIPAVTATVAHSLADGWTWAVQVPRLRPGDTVLILGPGPRGLALEIVRPGGRVILASTKGGRPISSLYSDVIVAKQLQVTGVLGPSSEGYRWGIQQLEVDPRLDTLVSHQFPLDESHLAMAATSGQLGHEELISVAISF